MAPRVPKLTFDGMFFTGSVSLPAWAGFGPGKRSKRAPKVLIESEVPFDVLDALDEGVNPELTPSQRKTLAHLVERQEAIRDAALDSLFASYPELRVKYLPHLDDPSCMPELKKTEGLRSLLCLKSICLHGTEQGGRSYFGLILECSWDHEHDVGIMMHRLRVVDVGGGDTAVLARIAEKDLRPRQTGKKRAIKTHTSPKKKTSPAKKKKKANSAK